MYNSKTEILNLRNHFSLSALDGPWYLLQKHVLQYVVFLFLIFLTFLLHLFSLLKLELAGTPAHNTVQHSIVMANLHVPAGLI